MTAQDNAPDAVLYQAAELKTKIDKLQEEYDMMQPAVINRIKELAQAQEKDKYAVEVGEYGKFSVSVYRKWTYSESTQNAEKHLKDVKKQEIADGTAKAEESEVLKFNVKKNEED